MCKEMGAKLYNEHWYEQLELVETSPEDKVTILQNQQIQTDSNIPNKKPDIIILDNEKRICMLTDVAVSGDTYDQEIS